MFWDFLCTLFTTVSSGAPQIPLCRRTPGSNTGTVAISAMTARRSNCSARTSNGNPTSGSISQRYGCGSGYGSGSFPFLKNVLSGLKQCLQNKIVTQNFSKKKTIFDWRWCAWGQVIIKKYGKNIFFCILKVNEERVGSEVGSGSGSISQRYGSGSQHWLELIHQDDKSIHVPWHPPGCSCGATSRPRGNHQR